MTDSANRHAELPLVLRAEWVVPITSPPIKDGAVAIAGGAITGVGPADAIRAAHPEARVRDLGCAALLPGFVNAHSHLELTAMRGLLEQADFREWIVTLTDVKLTRMSADDLLDSARLGALEALRAGVTTCADTCDTGLALDALLEAGMAGVVYQEVFGPDPAQADDSMAKLRDKVDALAARAAGTRVRVGISPHAPFTVSPQLFRRTTSYAIDRQLPVAIHTAESDSEDRFVRSNEGPFAERFAARGIRWEAQRSSTIAYFEQLGVLESRPLLIHAVRASERDLDAVARSGASIVHCPKSNAKLGHGTAPAALMRAKGIAVGLGTDSVASNNICDLLDEGRAAVFAARSAARDAGALTARDALEMATIGGARAIGLEREVGSLEAGKRADFCVVSLDGLHVRPVFDVEASLVFSASRADVALTMVAGTTVFSRSSENDGPFDEPRLRARLDEIQARIGGPRA